MCAMAVAWLDMIEKACKATIVIHGNARIYGPWIRAPKFRSPLDNPNILSAPLCSYHNPDRNLLNGLSSEQVTELGVHASIPSPGNISSSDNKDLTFVQFVKACCNPVNTSAKAEFLPSTDTHDNLSHTLPHNLTNTAPKVNNQPHPALPTPTHINLNQSNPSVNLETTTSIVNSHNQKTKSNTNLLIRSPADHSRDGNVVSPLETSHNSLSLTLSSPEKPTRQQKIQIGPTELFEWAMNSAFNNLSIKRNWTDQDQNLKIKRNRPSSPPSLISFNSSDLSKARESISTTTPTNPTLTTQTKRRVRIKKLARSGEKTSVSNKEQASTSSHNEDQLFYKAEEVGQYMPPASSC